MTTIASTKFVQTWDIVLRGPFPSDVSGTGRSVKDNATSSAITPGFRRDVAGNRDLVHFFINNQLKSVPGWRIFMC